MARIGFVGLGVMGGPIAGHLVAAGKETVVWNRTAAKCQSLVDRGAQVAPSLAQLGESCHIIFLCVNRTEDVQECLAALTVGARLGTVFVDHSTISPGAAVAIHKELSQQGFGFLDAPITGGSMGAQKGTLTVFCGGNQEDFAKVEPVMGAYAKTIALVGGPGKGQMTKMANQIAVGGSLLALCEALAFAKRAELDLETTRALLSGGAAGSWAMDNYGPKIVAEDWSPGFSIKNQRKDFAYCKEAAAQLRAYIPGTELVDQLLEAMERAGYGELATTSLFKELSENRDQ